MDSGPTVFGREAELELLRTHLRDPSAWAVLIHGIGGVGKTTLLQAFVAEAEASGWAHVGLDCQEVEPTEQGVLDRLAEGLGASSASLDAIGRRLRESPRPTLLTLDRYEAFRLMDTWLRRTLLPTLQDALHVVLASRQPPLLQWMTDPLIGPRFRSLRLGTLSPEAARAMLEAEGVRAEAIPRLSELTHGHPLALRLAGLAGVDPSSSPLRDLPVDHLLGELTNYHLSEIDDSRLRTAIEAASTLRRVTASTLGAMLGDEDPDELYRELSSLHFVEAGRDGLDLHDVVKDVIAAELRSRDPDRFAGYRRAAWQQMREEVRRAPTTQLWRYTADLIYLIENPVVREAFFPSTEKPFAVEPARQEDRDSIVEIASLHEPPEAVELLERWWSRAPFAFHVVRDGESRIQGFYCALDSERVDSADLDADPLTRMWRADLDDSEGGLETPTLFLRRWLSREDGERPSPVQAACWLDLKRSYLELRPRLRRVYLVLGDPRPYLEVASRLGFEPLAESVEIGGAEHTSARLDFGPRSVDGWLGRLFAQELGVEEGAGSILDPAARQVVTEAGRIDLSPLEFGVLHLLVQREGEAVSREQMLDEVWDIRHGGSSNVVDAVVRTLRKKLGDHAHRLESVRGVGYRFRGEPPLQPDRMNSHGDLMEPS